MKDIIIERLPFYWRLTPSDIKTPNLVNNYYPFAFDYDKEFCLVKQKRNEKVLSALDLIYKQEYNIGYLRDDNLIAKPYGKDFIVYLQNILKKNLNIKKILEIGCGGCVVLDKLKRNGYEVYGVDSSPFAAVEGAKKGVEVITDFFPSSKIYQKFDMIFHVDVLEHIDNYQDFLRHQYEQLNENGILVVNVPDASESINSGDISMAMHQHLNYFTEDSLGILLSTVGFEVISVDKAGYGGSLYAVGQKRINTAKIRNVMAGDLQYEIFSKRAEQLIKSFSEYSHKVLSNGKRKLGFYVPLRALPYISSQGIYNGFRFFDDTNHWHMNEFDGINVPVENFNDLMQNPVSDLMIMSLTFGEKIRNNIMEKFGNRINVMTLGDMIVGNKFS
jgi:2-polyprenyl-3-methyl-5-hydroxy-6-metoxy-1,4-benzoquinol methylase